MMKSEVSTARLERELKKTKRRVTELAESEAECWEAERKLRIIFESVSDGIAISDLEGNIQQVNNVVLRMHGYEGQDELIGRHGSVLIAARDLDRTDELFKRLIERGDSGNIELALARKDGSEFPLEFSLATWKSKEEVFFTAIGRDITDRQQAEKALQEAYEEVEKQVEERTAELKREVAERERLQQEIIEAQKHALQELSTPIIPITDHIIVMPLIGSIDTMRARDITRALLAGIREHRAKAVILDITGVPIVDSGVASHLNKTIQAARLKGAHTVVTGISDAVAETIVDLGIDWGGIETLSDLQTGLRAALARMGQRIER